jgi:hypothetical protein
MASGTEQSAAPFVPDGQIEANLAKRIPSALTPAPRTIRPVVATGIQTIDELLEGGLPLISCCRRTSAGQYSPSHPAPLRE